MTLRVLLVDDHPLFRQGVEVTLNNTPDIEVVGETDNLDEALRLIDRLRPDVVMMDLHMPAGSGIEATRRIADLDDAPHVLVMTMSEEDESLLAAVRAGAKGYLLKGSSRDEVLHAVRLVGAGSSVFSAHPARRLAALADDPPTATESLTRREREVLDLLARGWDNRHIARELVVSEKTVRNNVSNVFAKLGVKSRAAAIVQAHKAGFGR
ncbi:response regulator [Actinocrispum wychmicini]|uniref:DNA-binding NarL/FixJ family response regulator n=1 Tax=Actinocrispum wychmicini TaxID=1213861 RepID=A0A4R2IMQ5_9PSEU|nr:response regulator transcription factor [Actinocrispum wychmicini]TCO45259.1 DNA-binding NarL/FixJ family response regulator [Actinocrispum wychmicini]